MFKFYKEIFVDFDQNVIIFIYQISESKILTEIISICDYKCLLEKKKK